MYTDMEQWAEIRRKVLTGQISKRAACKEYDIHRDTLEKMLAHSEPPGYRRAKSRTSKLDPFLPVIQQILKADKSAHHKQRHTAKKIFERLRDETRLQRQRFTPTTANHFELSARLLSVGILG